jgi:hypothetical protein
VLLFDAYVSMEEEYASTLMLQQRSANKKAKEKKKNNSTAEKVNPHNEIDSFVQANRSLFETFEGDDVLGDDYKPFQFLSSVSSSQFSSSSSSSSSSSFFSGNDIPSPIPILYPSYSSSSSFVSSSSSTSPISLSLSLLTHLLHLRPLLLSSVVLKQSLFLFAVFFIFYF